MTIDKVQQALKYLPEGVEIKGNAVAVQNFFEALATGEDLLEELKEYKYNEYVICEKYNVSSIDDVYNKAIDDLSENLCCAFSENSTKGECEGFTCDILTLDSVSDLVISVSEQLRQQN